MSLNVDLMLTEDTSNSPEEFPDFIDDLPRYNHNQLAGRIRNMFQNAFMSCFLVTNQSFSMFLERFVILLLETDLLDVNPLGNSAEFMTYYPPTSQVLSIETPTVAPTTPFSAVTTMPNDFMFRMNSSNGNDDLSGPRGSKRAKPWTNQELYTPQARENFAAPLDVSMDTRAIIT